ncbi:hypothetical protein AGABI1DRAFT_92339 [Agaricus bisporus var. burnettii JB137-S8]|uniref:Peptidase C14 caspase domain-containing protein n=1 Tax=Agaricus bisporus var. burnettii (strain JB137-S8 / ATCC MYA-4627 / FGSC 10392) TaxID=597362 RepID=K5X727_AGABU|nr:uncharacterized protein AGABI1DRAFT_92339 [Agaricus bisporus var. burnettii JB137-S8]EKM78772.1 hypothetical protein AGABI1DRAFT_92339 [Agaricus bisporus var. burnettii JB137-S8]
MQGTNQLRKKALCIGINYLGHKGLHPLKGSVNDAHEVEKLLRDYYGYKPENIVILTDDNNEAARRPTRENIIKAMKELVKDAKPNDYLFFHYSGHGYRIHDDNGDESDKWDEAINPVDCMEKQESGQIVGYITDDEMHDIMVKPLPAGCRLTAIIDSCCSGTALDLPYVYSTGGEVKGVEPGNKSSFIPMILQS